MRPLSISVSRFIERYHTLGHSFSHIPIIKNSADSLAKRSFAMNLNIGTVMLRVEGLPWFVSRIFLSDLLCMLF
jgi:hypothetical protein